MKTTTKYLFILFISIICAITMFSPQLMVSPGHLMDGHTKLQNDCFSCHSLFSGTPNEKCVECHKVKDIGIFNTKGESLLSKNTKTVAFHQALTSNDCVSCHTDHQEDKTKRVNRKFTHDLLASNIKNNCISCHQKPKDNLHAQINNNCLQCHSLQKWKPAIFEHNKYFILDNDHNAKCSTCHVQNNFKQYTCYGCHEHTEAKIRDEHLEEGIKEFSNCAKCHKDSNEESAKKYLRLKNNNIE